MRAAQSALLPYAAPTSTAARLSAMWAERAAQDAIKRKELPAALAAARDGELGTLVRILGGAEQNSTPPTNSTPPMNRPPPVDRHGSNALHWAAGSGHLSICEALVGSFGYAVEGRQKDRRTPLHWAARNGHVHVCRWLVEMGGDPDCRTVDGTTPLHWAVWRGELGVCGYLVDEAKADLHATNSYGCNAVQWAAQAEPARAVEVCRWLQSRGLDLKLLNRNGHSAVHKAAVKGRRQRLRPLPISPPTSFSPHPSPPPPMICRLLASRPMCQYILHSPLFFHWPPPGRRASGSSTERVASWGACTYRPTPEHPPPLPPLGTPPPGPPTPTPHPYSHPYSHPTPHPYSPPHATPKPTTGRWRWKYAIVDGEARGV